MGCLLVSENLNDWFSKTEARPNIIQNDLENLTEFILGNEHFTNELIENLVS
jgi:hypothetical protein